MRLGLLWTLSAFAGALGAAIVFDTLPGINCAIWTFVVIVGLLIYRQPDNRVRRAIALPLGFAAILALGTAVTTAPALLAASVAIVASLLALTILSAVPGATSHDVGPLDIITAPVRGLAETLRAGVSGIGATFDSTHVVRTRPWLRGALIATPVVVVLALLFATADPLLARGRDAMYGLLADWDQIPRVVFGILLTLFVFGAYAATRTRRAHRVRPTRLRNPELDLGLVERRIVLSSAAAVCWLFVLLQLGYMFGASPAAVGSGVTFAEYAHRGFGELTIAATISVLLIIAARATVPAGNEKELRRNVGWPALALLAAVACILASAFHRILLYENAYGYTTLRVYVQAYILLALAILATLAWHVWRSFDLNALTRQVMTVSLATLAALVFWNGDAWVARANVDRYAGTGKIDVQYLTRGLSLDAYPTLVRAIPLIAEPERGQLAAALVAAHARDRELHGPRHWYEWNLRRQRARATAM